MGVLTPQSIQCTELIVAAQKTREIEYLGEVDFISSNQDVASILTGFNKINEKFGKPNAPLISKTGHSGSYYQHSFGVGKPCGLPKKYEEIIQYRYFNAFFFLKLN